MPKRDGRTRQWILRVNAREHAMIRRGARAAGLTRSAYLRKLVLDEAARLGVLEDPEDGASEGTRTP